MYKGLSAQQVQEQLRIHGPNVLLDSRKKHILLKFLEQFNNFLIYLLILAALISFFIGDIVDAILILSIVVLNAGFGFYQENKAENALALLTKIAITKVRVQRDGVQQEIDSRDLVPGDVMYLEEGSKVPADAKTLSSTNLEVNEASLTGESLAVDKHKEDPLYMGTIAVRGHGYAQVTATGMKTRFGTIASTLEEVQEEKTPLQKKLEGLTRIIGIVGIAAGVLVFLLSFVQGEHYLTAFLLSISLAVAVVPEGLPVVMTITLSIGVREMARRRAIVRKLAAIEALGSVTLIATDKTGTLTENKMKVKELYFEEKITPADNLKGQDVTRDTTLLHLLEDGVLCSTASLVPIHDHGSFEVLGDPTEGSLLLLATSLGINIENMRREEPIVEEIPFDSKTRMMSVAVKKGEHTHAYTKGSPESILGVSSLLHMQGGKTKSLTGPEKEKITKVVEQWASKGFRVLAFGYAARPKDKLQGLINKKAFVFLGMVAIHDAPRAEVPSAIDRARAAGIKVVMVTGDNARTAEAIALHTKILSQNEDIMTGDELEKYSDEELLKVLPKVRIFARVKPEDKYRIVKLYQKLGETVAVTGDGVNDAIALKQANVGIAMGRVGTDVARDVADIVITDDNFATIIEAVAEGRNIIKNLKNSIKYLLTSNFGEAVSLIVGFLLGVPALFYAIQLLYINLISDSFPAIAFAFSPRQAHLMQEPPAKEVEILNRFDKIFIFAAGGVATVLIIAGYFWFLPQDELLARTVAFSILAVMQSFIFTELWLNHRPIHTHVGQLRGWVFAAAFVAPFILQYILISVPDLASIFKVTTLDLGQFFVVCVIASLSLVGIAFVKKLFDHHRAS